MKKKFAMLFLTLSMSLVLCNTALANESKSQNNIPEISMPEGVTYELNLIEDNGEEYQEIIINTNSRASGTYSTDYDMTGGVYSAQSWACDATPTFNVTITPTSFAGASNEVKMGIKLQKKGTLGYSDVDEDYVTLKYGGTVTVKGNGSGTYRLYFRNYSGFKATGSIYVSFSY